MGLEKGREREENFENGKFRPAFLFDLESASWLASEREKGNERERENQAVSFKEPVWLKRLDIDRVSTDTTSRT